MKSVIPDFQREPLQEVLPGELYTRHCLVFTMNQMDDKHIVADAVNVTSLETVLFDTGQGSISSTVKD